METEKLKAKIESLIKEWSIGNSAEAKYRVEAYKELLEFIDSLAKQKLPKWKKVKNPQPCWSGEIGVDPIKGQFQYENWVISANKLFKLLEKEDGK